METLEGACAPEGKVKISTAPKEYALFAVGHPCLQNNVAVCPGLAFLPAEM